MIQIIIAIISGLCVAIPSIIATISSNKNAILKNKESNDLVLYRIDELDKKVHEHNNLIDRMYKVEMRVTLLEDDKKR